MPDRLRRRISHAALLFVAACGTTLQGGAVDGGPDGESTDGESTDAQVDVALDVTCPPPTAAACDAGLPETCDGCAPPIVLATCQSMPGAIALDEANVYWINQGVYAGGGGKVPVRYKDGAVMKCAKSGCNGSPAPVAVPLSQAWALSLARSGSSVFFSALIDAGSQPGGTYMILSHDTQTCTTTPSPWLGGAGGYMLAADDASVFLTDYNGCRVYGCAAAGCTQPTLLWLAPNTNNQLTTGIAVDATDVYWGDTHGDLFRCAKSGCAGKPTLIGQTPWLTEVGQLALDDTTVYATGTGILSCAKSGCTTATVFTPNAGPQSAIATDGVNVYWTSSAGVYRCPVSGCASPTLLASTRSVGAASIAVDGVNVYWSDTASGTIFALPK